MDWLSILNECLDIILPAVASVIAILFGVLGVKIKQIYNEKIQNETVQAIIENAVKWAQQTFDETQGAEKLEAVLEQVSSILLEKGIEVTTGELIMFIESAVYSLKEGITTTVLEVKEETTEETDETVEENTESEE